MRISKKFLGAIYVSALLCISFPAHSQLLMGSTVDFAGDVAATMTPILEKIQTFRDEAIKFVKEKTTKLKASLGKYIGKRKKTVEKIPGTRNFAESSVDIYDAVAVQAAVNELFLQYPSDVKKVMTAYEKEAEVFYYDTLIEVYTASRRLEAQLDSVRQETDKFVKDSLSSSGDAGGVASSEDENGNYYNLYIANKKFNDVLQITQEVMAMYGQYYAASTIYRQYVMPAAYVKPEDGEKSKDEPKKESSASRYFSEKLVFAQMLTAKSVAPAKKELAVQDSELSSETEATPAAAVSKKMKIEFVKTVAPEPKSPLYNSRDKLAALGKISEVQTGLNYALDAHNAKKLMPTFRELFIQYEIFKKLHQKAVDMLALSDQCVIQYLGRRYKDPSKVWYGSSIAPKNTIDYDNRTGLSGWAVSAFQVAKIESSFSLDADSYTTVDFGAELDSDSLEPDPRIEQKIAESNPANGFASPSKEAEFADSVRSVELIPWQVGALAAKSLAADQRLPNPNYGRADNPFPIWQDQKSFYNQYINGKYDNMIEYVQSANLNSIGVQIADIINQKKSDKDVTQEDIAQRRKNSNDLATISKAISKEKSEKDSRVDAINAAKNAALQDVLRAQDAAISPLEDQKTALQEILDNISLAINLINEDISDSQSNALLGKIGAEAASQKIIAMNKRETSEESGLYDLAKYEFSSGSKQHISETDRLIKLRADVKELEKQRSAIHAQIAQLNERIKTLKESYVPRLAAIEAEYDSKLSSTASKSTPKLNGFAKGLGISNSSLFNILADADGLLDDSRDIAVELINQARADIFANGDNLYSNNNHQKIIDRHNKLINDLKRIPTSKLRSQAIKTVFGFGTGDVSSILSILSTAMQQAVISSVCSDSEHKCDEADTEYFIGLPAKKRDFAGPKEPLAEFYPPMRDIVHFDVTDYQAVPRTSDGVISRTDFINYGGEMPQIWKLILSDRAFVEKGIDLSSMLRQGNEDLRFMRGTGYPCRLDKNVVDIDKNTGKFIVRNDVQKTMPVCTNLSLKNSGLLFTITDSDLNESVPVTMSAGQTPKESGSELGTLLRYANQRLRYGARPQDVYTRLIDIEEEAKKGKAEQTVRDMVYEKAIFKSNQIGNFLHFVDKEQKLRKSVDEMKADIEQTIRELKEMLEPLGFEVSPDLNLANKEDYDYINQKIDEYKDGYVGEAGKVMSEIDHGDPTVKERYDMISNTRAALIQDHDEVISLDNATKAGSSLNEMIKTENANQKLLEKKQQEGYDAMLKEVDKFERPLCAAY